MPIEYALWYTRQEIKANPNKLYIFGDNFARNGYGGQAKEARGEPNSIGIPTKRYPSWDENAFLTNEDFEEWHAIAQPIFNRIERELKLGHTIVWPQAGIGTRRAQLATRAPRIFSYICDFLTDASINFEEMETAKLPRPARTY